MIFIERYFHLTNYKNRDNVKKKLNVKLKIVNKLFLKKIVMKFLKIFYLTAFVVMVTLGVNLLINETKEENQTYETLQTINTFCFKWKQFQNFKTFSKS